MNSEKLKEKAIKELADKVNDSAFPIVVHVDKTNFLVAKVERLDALKEALKKWNELVKQS